MRLRLIALVGMVILLLAFTPIGFAQQDQAQLTVECTGWHALCSMATGCALSDNTASCKCWRVNERHVVVTAGIKNDTFGYDVKGLTQSTCTNNHPCGLDQAPVCQAIRNLLPSGEWVSTFSYRGWSSNWKPVACQGRRAGPWADCMTSACSESQNPQDRHRPLTCQCTAHNGAFVGTNGTCNSPAGTVMSTIEISFWDFASGEFAAWAQMPANESVKEACAALTSDPQ